MKLFSLLALFLLLISSARAAVRVVPQSRSAAQLKPQTARIEAVVQGDAGFAQVKETWIFSNAAKANFEAELECEAPKNALMTGFAYYFRGERVLARVVEKTRAANIYNLFNPTNLPMTARRDPALVEMLARNRLKVRVGPVEAQIPLVIELMYSQPLETANGTFGLPLLLRDEKQTVLENFSFASSGAPAAARFSLGQSAAKFEARDFDLPTTASLSFAAPAQFAMLQSGGDSGFFAAILSEAQWKTRANWKGSSEIVSKALDAKRVLVAGRFQGTSPAKIVGLKARTDAGQARLWWMALQIETLENDGRNWARVVELSNASNLPSAFSSWLAIPASERKAMEERLHPRNAWEESAQISRLGNALALWKAEGKTETPQYRAMLSDFEARLVKSNGSYNEETLKSYETAYVSVIANSLDRYARNGDDLSGFKLPAFEHQFQRLNAQNYQPALQKARDTLHTRRLVARLSVAAKNGKPVNLAVLDNDARYELLRQLLDASVAARAKNPALARRLRAFVGAAAAASKYDLNPMLRDAESKTYGNQVSRAREAYSQAVIKNQQNTPQGRHLERQFRAAIARTEVLGHDGLAVDGTIGKLYADKQVAEHAARPDAAKIARLDAEIVRLTRYSSSSAKELEETKKSAWHWVSWDSLGALIARESLRNGPDSPRARAFKAEWRQLHPDAPISYLITAEQGVLNGIAQPLVNEYFDQTTEPAPNAARVEQIRAQLKALEARSSYNTNYFSGEVLASGWHYQQVLEAKIRAEGAKSKPDAARMNALIEALGQFTASWRSDWLYQRFWQDNAEGKGRGTAQEYAQAKAERLIVQDDIARAKEKFAADKNASLAARARYNDQIAELRQRENQLRVRMGDPLIAVQAPANAKLVLAILPTGALLPLRFDAQTKQWQARFDVPTHTAPGDYPIQIVVVFADGKRQTLTMHLSVDLSAPEGLALARIENGAAVLSLETDAFTNRVTAFTPWGARVELRRDEAGIFRGRVHLPESWSGGAWRFVVTDEAHNRTEITVDLEN